MGAWTAVDPETSKASISTTFAPSKPTFSTLMVCWPGAEVFNAISLQLGGLVLLSVYVGARDQLGLRRRR